MGEKYELLAPVGNFSMLHAAVDAGADAVYFGFNDFTMRVAAKNFSLRDMPKFKKICDSKGVKKFLTLNSIIYESELKKLDKLIQKVKPYVDAIICWDMAVINLCRKYNVPFHVSTQASISNSESAEFYKKLGAERVILARELNLKQIKKIAKENFVECFAHGAMCVSISGRCFTSQFIHGAKLSANRGACAHPCRRAWNISDDEGNELKLENNRVMSAKDLCTLPFIEKMKAAGIRSFKIEGRNRTPEYVSTVVRVYRRALDKKLSRKDILEGLDELKKVYNRGFSSGFFIKMPTSDDFSFSENGEQTERKKFIGRIEKWWPKANAASLKVFNSGLKKGKEVLLISEDLGAIRTKVSSIEVEGEGVKIAKKGEEYGVVFENSVRLPRGTEVYLIESNSDD